MKIEEILSDTEKKSTATQFPGAARSASGKGPLVAVVMGSESDWPTLSAAASMLEEMEVPYEARVVSAHRTPDFLSEFAKSAESRGLQAIIAGAGGAAHLPGMLASQTIVPVLGVPVQSKALSGMDSLLSIVQMPGGIPVGTLAIGNSGAKNAALLAMQIIGLQDQELRDKLRALRESENKRILATELTLSEQD